MKSFLFDGDIFLASIKGTLFKNVFRWFGLFFLFLQREAPIEQKSRLLVAFLRESLLYLYFSYISSQQLKWNEVRLDLWVAQCHVGRFSFNTQGGLHRN